MEIDTSVDGLYELQSKLEQFKNSSNYMKLQIMAETEEFEMEIQNRCCELKEESEDEFQMLWLQYIKCKENFQEHLERLLSQNIINEDGKRTIYTLIRILEEYHRIFL